MSRPKNILVIGGTKFIGLDLVSKFVKKGDQVYVFSRSVESIENISVNKIKGDRDKPSDLKNLSRFTDDVSFDCVYDMCCYNPEQAKGLLKVLGENIKSIAFFSSAAVYAPSNTFPLSEDTRLGHHESFGNYGVNKARAEAVFIDYCKLHNIKLTILRPHYILGVGDYFKRHNYFFDKLINKQTIEVPGNGEALIQFAYSGDVVNAFLQVPFSQKSGVDILNIASDRLITLNGVVELFATAIKQDAIIENIDFAASGMDEKHFYDDGFPFPNLNLVIDSTKIKKMYNIEVTELETYIQELLSDWKRSSGYRV